ncbi:MAG: LysM domain-containing protein [bacterium]|nr:LysM domain-containing protein [bacterium]
MDEFYQDQETVIQQLRLLLAAKEEELARLRGASGDGGREEATVADGLIRELEEKKEEAAALRAKLKKVESGARERLDALAAELEEKERALAAASGGGEAADPAEAGNGRAAGLEETLAAEREEWARRRAELEERLAERESLLAEAGRARAAFEERIAELMRELERMGDLPPAPEAPAADAEARIRSLEGTLEEREAAYRTAQVQVAALRRGQAALRGVAAGLGVALLFIVAMKVKQYNPIPAEAMAFEVRPLPAAFTVAEESDLLPRPEPPPAAPAPREEIPAAAPAPAAERVAYTVKKGDNIWLICRRVLNDPAAVERVIRENDLSDPNALHVGDVIYLTRE